MKVIAGVVIAGAAAGAAVLALPGMPGVLPAEPKRKFATPVWDPEAEWRNTGEVLAGSQATGFLDGPRQEVMWTWGGLGLGRCSMMRTAGRTRFDSYDPESERIHALAGSAHGYLDGPFSRARLGGWDYSHRGSMAGSPDGRYVYFMDPWNGRALRGLDMEKQMVFTVTTEPIPSLKGITADGQGRLLAVQSNGTMLVFTPGSKEAETRKLETPEGAYGGQTLCLTVDPVHNRLYCSPSYQMSKKWYVWYWDLADGKHHGVLPMPQEGEPRRKGGMGASEAGPFKGTSVYPECYIGFGPDDPEYRFIYMRCTDQWALYRLDLQKQEMHAFSYDEAGKVFRFITAGMPRSGPVRDGLSMIPTPEGDFSWATAGYKGNRVYRIARVK